MKKILSLAIVCCVALAANAVPAKRGWQTRTQADGTTIELQQLGDEFYHYLVNRDGQEVRLNEAGMYVVVGQAPTPNKVRAARTKAKVRKQKMEFGVTPNLAPRGIVIMVNYKDQTFASSNTHAVIDSLCNAKNCTVNKYEGVNFPSAGQYFRDQSNGAYAPIFDVFGPVTLKNNTAYYGENDGGDNDKRPVNMLIEACKLADQNFGVDFTQYDSDGDGKVDFVYIIYAGAGEASGGAETTIWPHSYSVNEQFALEEYYSVHPQEFKQEYGYDFEVYLMNEYTRADCMIDGKQINTYACSNELTGNSLDGIGTLCHEFSHVMGLPDFYDTNYGTNYENHITPNDWNIMDGGSYNCDGHCPPNYSAWEKYFMGWHTPVNLGEDAQRLTLQPNGTTGYQAYQVTENNQLVGPHDSVPGDKTVYYLENRQLQGWDRGLPHHGLLIWQVRYSRNAWSNNAPNNTNGKPRYTLLSASGTTIGTWYEESWIGYDMHYDGPKNAYPGSQNVTSKTIAGKPLKSISESNSLISLIYIDESSEKTVTWMVNGAVFDTKTYQPGEALTLPTKSVTGCEGGATFIGWTAEQNWCDPIDVPADLFTDATGKTVTKSVTYYAVFE